MPDHHHTVADLTAALRRLGVQAGDMLFVHSSFRSLGPVAGGAGVVVEALERATAPGGLILMPSFNLVPMDQRLATWNVAQTPSTVGWLTEFFRQMPGTLRSNHYSHAVAARGDAAAGFLARAAEQDGLASPWDRPGFGWTYGSGSPLLRAYQEGGKLLLLGAPYKSVTHIHMVEVLRWNRLRQTEPGAPYRFALRQELGEWWELLGRVRCGRVGQADCRLFALRDFVDTLLAEVEANPERWFNPLT